MFQSTFKFEGQGSQTKQFTQLLVYCSIFDELLNIGEYQFEQSTIRFELKQFSFVIKSKTQQELEKFQQYLSKIKLIVYETKSIAETSSIQKLLLSEPLYKNLKNQFNCQIAKIETLESINYSDLFTQSDIIGDISFTSYFNELQPNHLVFIFDNNQNIEMQYCINQFADFIKLNIKVGKKSLKIDRQLYLEKAMELIQFQNSQKEALIDVTENDDEFTLQFTYWYFGNDENGTNLIKSIIEKINKILFEEQQIFKSAIMRKIQTNSLINQNCINHKFENLNLNIIEFLKKQFINNQYCQINIDQQSGSVKVFFSGPEKKNQQARASQILENIRSNILQIQSKKFLQIPLDSIFKIRIEQRIQDAIYDPICKISYLKYEDQFIYFEVIHAGEIFKIEEQLNKFIETESFSLINSDKYDQSNLQSEGNSVATENIDFQIIDQTEQQFYLDWLAQNQKNLQQQNFPQSPDQQRALYFEKFQTVNQQKKLQEKQIIQIKYQGKEQKLIIKEGNLAEEDCELFVIVVKNFQNLIDKNEICNQTIEIIKKFGIDFEREMPKFQQIGQEVNQILIKVNQKYILALKNAYFYDEDGKANDQCPKEIKSNMNLIFKTVNEKRVKSVAMTIFGCGPCDFSFEKASEIVLLEILKNYRSENLMQKLVVVEKFQKRVEYLINKIQNTEDDSFNQKWKLNGIVLNDSTNLLINKAVEHKITKQEIELSFFQQQSTHEINLRRGEILQLKTQTIQKFHEVKKENITKFYINYEPVDERLNDFLIQLKYFNYKKTKMYQEKIFLIIDQDQMNYWIQIGEQKFKLEKELILFNELNTIKKDITINQDIQINQEQNQEIIQQDQFMPQDRIALKFEFPKNFRDKFNKFILQKLMKGQFRQFDQHLDMQTWGQLLFQKHTDWNKIENKLIIEELPQDHKDYRLIKDDLKNYNIKKVVRISNNKLYEQYNLAKEQLIKSYEIIKIKLNDIELNRMLWAVLKNHPKNSYSEKSPGIESFFGDWGQGTYFTKNFTEVNYYKDIDQQDIYLALLCLVSTGRYQVMERDKRLYRSLDGYDSNCSPDQNTFILYEECAQRAYPLYQVEFQIKI